MRISGIFGRWHRRQAEAERVEGVKGEDAAGTANAAIGERPYETAGTANAAIGEMPYETAGTANAAIGEMPYETAGTAGCRGDEKAPAPADAGKDSLFRQSLATLKESLPHMVQGALVFLAFVLIGFLVTRSLSTESIRHFYPYFTPTPYLEFFGIKANSPYWIEVLELQFCHQFEVVSAIWSGYFLSVFGYFFLAGEGFELSFMNVMRGRSGGFSWAVFAARLPQYALGYSTIILSAAIGFNVMMKGFRGERTHPKKLLLPTAFCMFLMFANDCMEALYF